MPCDSVRNPQQTVAERQAEVRSVKKLIDALLAAKKVKVKIGPQGAVAFIGIPDGERKGVTDNCVYNHIMTRGSHAARQEIVKAEQRAGRAVDKKVVATGLHSHDGGRSWHPRG